jgi:hypothetical protein
MAFLFLSKKKLLGGSSTEMGVSSSLKIHPASGFPFVNCKGVIIEIRLSISLDGCFRVTSLTSLFDLRNNESPDPYKGISAWPWACLLGLPFSGFPSFLWGTLSPCFEVLASHVFPWFLSLLGLESFAPLSSICFATGSFGASSCKIGGRQLHQCS